MTATHPEQDIHQYPAHFEPPHGSTWKLFFGPGLVRGAWMAGLGFVLGMLLVLLLRAWWGWDPLWNTEVILVVGAMVMAPIFFLAGIGSFDYWLHYISGRPTQPEDHSGHGAYSWKDYFRVNTDHKVIGIQYLVTTFVFFTIGGLMAMFFRAELAQPGLQFVDSQTFNGLVSVHATLMIFLFIIPAFAGLANFAVPLMLGAPDMAFPRLNALSFWLLPIAGIMFVSSFLAPGGAFGAGWTGYAPLSEGQPLGQTFFNMGVQWAGASSIMTALNFLVTIITMRAPGMTFWRMPLLVWANFTTSLLVVLATPFIAGSQFFVLFDRIMHTSFFVPDGGGYVLGYQHIFWFYSHPAVYIMMLPGFGIVSEVISTMSRKPIFGYRLMALSLLGILVLGFSVWAHHMFVAGMADWLRVPMMITTLLIAIPTGIKVFSWIATLWRGRIHLTTPMLFALGFVTMFVIGGLSGIYLGSVPIDIAASDTYFIVAHIHYVLFGGSVFTIYAGVYYWFPKMTGRMYSETLGKWHFWLTFVSFNATFFPMHYIGLRGMPRRVFDYDKAFGDLNLFISIASFVLGASFIVFVYNMITSWSRGPIAPANPWHARTLEWQVSSPPPIFNFDEIPQVVGGPYEYGVPGARHAVLSPTKDAEEARDDRGGARVTAHAEPLHGQHDEHHGPPPANQSSRVDPRTLGMLLFIGSEIMLFGSFFAAYFFVRVVNPSAPTEWPPAPYEFPVFVAGVNTCILVTSSFTMHWALQSIKRGERKAFLAGMVLTFLMGLAFLCTQVIEYLNVGFNTGDGAFASVFFGLTGLHGAHVAIGLSLLLMVIIRGFRGHYSPEHHHGVELPGIYWHFVDVMWIVVYSTVYLI